MPLSLLEMVNQVETELGLEESSTVFGVGPSLTAKQMGALANRVLDELRRSNRWAALQFEYNLAVEIPIETTGNMAAQSAVITGIPDTSQLEANFWTVSGDGLPQAARIASVDSLTQVTLTMENTNTSAVTGVDIVFAKDTYPMPSGFDFYNNQTMWDRTNFWQLMGPDSPQQDQYDRSGIVSLGPRRHWRQIGPYANKFRLWPPPTEITAPLQIVFEYLSINAVDVNGLGTSYAQYFENDSDTCLLDENAIIMGIKWMFWEIKGMGSYVTLQNRWIDYVRRLIARDAGAPVLTMSRQPLPLLISSADVQDGNYPSEPSSS